jgi:hypothetical protein
MAAVGRREATDTALPKARSRSIAWMRAFMSGFANLADIDKKLRVAEKPDVIGEAR